MEWQPSKVRPSLWPWDIAQAALRAGRRYFLRVATITLAVYGPLGAGEALVKSFFNPAGSWSSLFAEVALASINVLGVTFLAGVLGRVVGTTEHGLPELSVWQILRRVPYRSLIWADFLVSISSGIGFLMLVVPGFVIFTLLSLTGATVRLEGKSGAGALLRSAQVVRHHFWTAFLLSPVIIAAGGAISDLVEALSRDPYVVYFLVRLLADGTAAALCGLMQSELGFRLLTVRRIQEAAGSRH